VVAQTSNEGFNSLVVDDPRNPDAHIRETSDVLAQWFVPGVASAFAGDRALSSGSPSSGGSSSSRVPA
jgi:hypothetical protein